MLLIEWKPWAMREVQHESLMLLEEFESEGLYVEGMVEANDRLISQPYIYDDKPMSDLNDRQQVIYRSHMTVIFGNIQKEERLLANATRIRDRHMLQVIRLKKAHKKIDRMLAESDGRLSTCEPSMPKKERIYKKMDTLEQFMATLNDGEKVVFKEKIKTMYKDTGLVV